MFVGIFFQSLSVVGAYLATFKKNILIALLMTLTHCVSRVSVSTTGLENPLSNQYKLHCLHYI